MRVVFRVCTALVVAACSSAAPRGESPAPVEATSARAPRSVDAGLPDGPDAAVDAPPAAPPTSYAGAERCAARVKLMRERFALYDEFNGWVPGSSLEVALPSVSAADDLRFEDATAIWIDAAGKMVVKYDQALEGTVKAKVALVEAARKERSYPVSIVYVGIDASAALVDVLPLLKAMSTKVELRLIVNVPPRLPYPLPETPAWVIADLETARNGEPANRGVLFAAAMTKAVGTCQAVSEAFGRVAEADPGNKLQAIIEGVPDAIGSVGCVCALLDVDAIETLVLGVTDYGTKADLAWLALRSKSAGTVITLPKDAGGAQLAAALAGLSAKKRRAGVVIKLK